MKRLSSILSVLLFLLIVSGQGYAQIDNLTNMSAEWVRMSNRNAATDATDIVVYNPAGLVSLSNGFHINASNQMMFRKPEHTFTDPLTGNRQSFKQDSPDWFVPNVYAAYTKDKWSFFGAVYMPGSAGAIDYPDGSVTTRLIGLNTLATVDGDIALNPDNPLFGSGLMYTGLTNEHLKGTSLYLASSIGGAYKINDQVSVAAGIRNIYVKNTVKGGLTLTGDNLPDQDFNVDVELEGNGWGGVLGIQIKPDDKLNVAFHYETQVKIDLKTMVKSGDNISQAAGLYTDRERNRRDFPGMIGMGVSYQFTPAFRGEFDANYWFQQYANWGDAATGDDIAGLARDCWSIGVGGVYQLTPQLEVSAGTLYTGFRWDDMDAYYNANAGSFEVQYSDNINLATGIGYKVLPGLKLNLGVNYTWWKSEEIEVAAPINQVNMKNSTCIVAVGIDYSL